MIHGAKYFSSMLCILGEQFSINIAVPCRANSLWIVVYYYSAHHFYTNSSMKINDVYMLFSVCLSASMYSMQVHVQLKLMQTGWGRLRSNEHFICSCTSHAFMHYGWEYAGYKLCLLITYIHWIYYYTALQKAPIAFSCHQMLIAFALLKAG